MNKIIDARKEKGVSFGDLNIGDCFTHDNGLYMKIRYNEMNCAVNLENGTLYAYFYGVKVLPVAAIMQIVDKEDKRYE